MARRLQLQTLLEGLMPEGKKVYFQPPANVQMEYPCIVYQPDNARAQFAGNLPYRFTQRYAVTIIDPNPDTEIPFKVALLPMSAFNRFFVVDNLNHHVYVLYY